MLLRRLKVGQDIRVLLAALYVRWLEVSNRIIRSVKLLPGQSSREAGYTSRGRSDNCLVCSPARRGAQIVLTPKNGAY